MQRSVVCFEGHCSVIHPARRPLQSPSGGSQGWLKSATTAASLALYLMVEPVLASEAADQLTERLAPIETYQASFVQRLLDGSGERLQEVEGDMWLARPGKLRWETQSPYAQTVVSDGDKVFLYDPDLEQLTVRDLDTRLTYTPALLLSGDISQITERYQIHHSAEGSLDAFTLIPADEETLFERLQLKFEGDTLEQLWMTDSTGQRTAIQFDNIKVNQAIESTSFELEVPDGVDTIRQGS